MFTHEKSSDEKNASNKISEEVIKLLISMEIAWTADQKKAWKTKIKDNIKKKQRDKEYIDILLRKCKDHGGPITEIAELKHIVKKNTEPELKKILRKEVALQKMIHPNDSKERPELYKMNYLAASQMVENLTILLDQVESTEQKEILFPIEDEIDEILIDNEAEEKNKVFVYQQPLAVVWDDVDGREWYIAFYLDEVDNIIRVDHLQSVRSDKDRTEWSRASVDDIQEVKTEQIIPCDVSGEWTFSKRNATFTLANIEEIDITFKTYFA